MARQIESYRITNRRSGVDLGTYEGETELAAYQEMLREAGYDSAADLPEGQTWDEVPAELSVEEVSQ